MISCFTTFAGTILETIVTMYLFGSLWDRWTMAFKVVTPLLHVAFSACQLHGSRVFYTLWRKQERLIREQNGDFVEDGKKGVLEESPEKGLSSMQPIMPVAEADSPHSKRSWPV